MDSYSIRTKYTGTVFLETMFSLHSPYQLTYTLNKIQFMTNIKLLLFRRQGVPSSGSLQEQWNTNPTHQFRYWSPSLVSVKYFMHYNRPHIGIIKISNNTSKDDQYLDWNLYCVLCCSRKLPEDGISVPKHVGVWYLPWMVFYDMYLIECTRWLIWWM